MKMGKCKTETKAETSLKIRLSLKCNNEKKKNMQSQLGDSNKSMIHFG